MNIYVGNLSGETGEADLRQAFEVYGEVTRTRIVLDKETNKSKGFGFVGMADNAKGQLAIDGLSGKQLHGQKMKINEARRLSESYPGR